MKLNEPVAVGQILNLTVGLDEHRMVKVSSQVMWVKERRQGDKKVYHIGVKIIDKMDQDEIDFVRFVAGKMMECFRDSEERGGSDEISVEE
jgi:Tfp pilus assembly protein PilZ